MALPNEVWELSSPEQVTLTHYQIARINIEIARPLEAVPRDGYVEIWIAKMVQNADGTWNEVSGIPGIFIKLEGDSYDGYIAALQCGVGDLCLITFDYLLQLGLIPDGTYVEHE